MIYLISYYLRLVSFSAVYKRLFVSQGVVETEKCVILFLSKRKHQNINCYQINTKTHSIVTFLTAIERTEGSNLLQQFGTDVSTRQPKQPAGREQLSQYGHPILEMTAGGAICLQPVFFRV